MKKNKFNPEDISFVYKNSNNKTQTIKDYCKKIGIVYEDKFRKKMNRYVKNRLDISTKELPSALEKGRLLSIDEYCNKYNLDRNSIKSYTLLTHNKNNINYNIEFNNNIVFGSIFTDTSIIESIVKQHIKPVTKTTSVNIDKQNYFDRLVYADVHIGMSPEAKRNGVPQYTQKYDADEINTRVNKMIEFVIINKISKVLVIDDLGDFIDGLGGETVRKNHQLVQNMDDREMFETAINFKVTLVDKLLVHYDYIVCNSIVNDNHSGVFSYFVNSTTEKILLEKYPERVTFSILEKFINHYFIDDSVFILSHGKDMHNLKLGFKPNLNPIQIEKIDQYCKEYGLYQNKSITFCKGDSHQMIFDFTTSNDFHYFSYPAFCPSSDWISTNFKKSKSGFVFEVHSKDSKTITPYWF